MRKKILLLLKAGFKFERMIREYLQREDVEVAVVGSARELLRRLKMCPHVLLIVEQDTYEMDCLELLLNIQDVQSNIQVVFLGSADQENKEEIVRLGGIYLDSPISTDALREVIDNLS
jgi:DNA-binding response OmpR family regulator